MGAIPPGLQGTISWKPVSVICMIRVRSPLADRGVLESRDVTVMAALLVSMATATAFFSPFSEAVEKMGTHMSMTRPLSVCRSGEKWGRGYAKVF